MGEQRPSTRTFAIETLEERQVLSASYLDPSYQEWLSQTISVGQYTPVEVAIDGGASSGDGFHSQDAETNNLIRLSQATQTWPQYTGQGYSVAVIDTGIDYRHSALGGEWGTKVIAGWDFVNNDADPMDDNGHGTHVAGIIASTNSTYRGIAPGVNLIALKVLGANGSGSFANVEKALQWVVDHQQQYNIVAVNLSLGTGNFTSNPYTFLEDEFSALKSKGVFTAVAAGNGFYSYNSQVGLGYPAISPNVISVGAVWDANFGSVTWSSGARDYQTAADRMTSFSQRSSAMSLVAPGAMLISTYLGNSWSQMAGTSMATPVIAGAAALLHQVIDAAGTPQNGNQDYIYNLMRQTGVTVVDNGGSADNVVNTGLSFKRLDIFAAMQSVLQSAPTENYSSWVTGLLRDVLDRATVNPNDIAYWDAAIQSGLSLSTVANIFVTSPENRVQTIQSYFTKFLGRQDPTPTSWLPYVNATGRIENVLAIILTSDEYYARNGGTMTGFVSALTRDLLGRTAPAEGAAQFAAAATAAQLTRAQVASIFFNSNEYRWNLVKEWSQAFLRRPAGAAEAAYVSQMGAGASQESIQVQMLASSEYRDVAQGLFGSGGSGGAAGAGAAMTMATASEAVLPAARQSAGTAHYYLAPAPATRVAMEQSPSCAEETKETASSSRVEKRDREATRSTGSRRAARIAVFQDMGDSGVVGALTF